MDNLESIRKHYGMTKEQLAVEGFYAFGIELGELDTLVELHRLLYDC